MLRAAPLALLLPVLAACGERPTPQPGGAGAGASPSKLDAAHTPSLRAASNAGGFVVEVAPLGGPIPMNVAFAVELALFAPDGVTPLEPEEVTLDARMEEHEHGMLRDVALEPTAPGHWRAQGLLFHMVGVWQFQVDVRQGAHVERAQLDFLLR